MAVTPLAEQSEPELMRARDACGVSRAFNSQCRGGRADKSRKRKPLKPTGLVETQKESPTSRSNINIQDL